MNKGLGTKPSKKSFEARIVLIVFAVLLTSEFLATFLTYVSFEKFFLGALESKYIILGKDLRRKIEGSLKFGKRLEGFVGMNIFFQSVFRHSDDLETVLVTDHAGNLLYSSKISGEAAWEKGSHIKAFDFFDWQVKPPIIKLYGKSYYVMLPIIPKYGGERGILALVFPKRAIQKETDRIMKGIGRQLAFSIILSLFIIWALIRYLVLVPAKKQFKIAATMTMSGGKGVGSRIKTPLEMTELLAAMKEYAELDKTNCSRERNGQNQP